MSDDVPDRVPGNAVISLDTQLKTSSKSEKSSRMRTVREAMVNRRKERLCKRTPDLEVRMVSSQDVNNNLVQDKSKPVVVIGSDVVSLYPNLRSLEAGEEIFQAVMASSITWEGVNWQEAVRYIAMTRGYKWCQESRLRRVLPERHFARGSWPGVTGPGPSGPHSGDIKQWDFPNVLVTELDKKAIIGEVLRMGVETLFSTHIYSFGGSTYRQTDGGPIGLRSTCANARVVMARYTIKWKAKLTQHNIHLEGDALYVDDGRVF